MFDQFHNIKSKPTIKFSSKYIYFLTLKLKMIQEKKSVENKLILVTEYLMIELIF